MEKSNNKNYSHKKDIILLKLKILSLRSVGAKMEFQRCCSSNPLVHNNEPTKFIWNL